ncbi:flagellar basal-body MS-ring/collar protein FliF [uncultured Nocardioides sp.]|jgi:flagellar M-ring protein FliF|uniref:flagellar basal-body MS-ring/collar protein FliF n=1 Tax=uncultured Nocardioides sp. TaxID=198441 RepID=UPI000C4A5551|nr:flagellar basal-body MS-ring/collar protein FliF [uncultured Nocardioides sp.]MAO81563.1 flagellar M-ring protein FliF [Nocardioides sp.]
MREMLQRSMNRHTTTFQQFTAGQKVVAVIGTAALLLGGFMVFRWASAPAYAPLFSNLAPSDASSVIDELETQGVSYELADGGGTIMVPRDAVHSTRIALSGEGLPTSSEGGYGILDDQGISTSEFKEQTDFKRAMEGELAATVKAIDGVNGAVVHLAIPQKDVFTDEQQPPTASVLVQTNPGRTLTPEQVQAVVHLVASSIDGLDPDNVTVADSTGRVLSSPGGTTSAAATERTQQTEAYQDQLRARLQAMLDRVVGPGNSTVSATVELDFDKAVTETTDYRADEEIPALTESLSSETYSGAGEAGGVGGVVGVDDQTDTTAGAGGDSSYNNSSSSRTNGVDTVVETRETTPGAVKQINVGVVLDTATTQGVSATDVRTLVADAIGINGRRGDTIRVVTMPFDRSGEQAAQADLEAAAAAEAAAARNDLIEKGAMGGAVLLVLLLALVTGRRRAKKREQATTYVVEQLRQERQALEPPAALALAEAEQVEEHSVREELSALIERQPEDVATLLRGWLVER